MNAIFRSLQTRGSGGLLNKFNRPKVKVLLYKYKGLNGAQFVVCGRKEKFGNITK